MPSSPVAAICCADIHLSLKPPIARVKEPDWFEAMDRQLTQIAVLQNKYKCPVLIAGDIFDRWNAPAELINFALEALPNNCCTIPGNHDLPYHNYSDIKKSAYWTLVKSGKIKHLEPGGTQNAGHFTATKYPLMIDAFPYGFKIGPPTETNSKAVHIALVHAFCWNIGTFPYPNAPEEQLVSKYVQQLEGYDIAIFGDNHRHFSAHTDDLQLFNCGTVFRRTISEIAYQPVVGLIHADKTVSKHYLVTSNDIIHDIGKELETTAASINTIQDFVDALDGGRSDVPDLADLIKQCLRRNQAHPEVRKILTEALESFPK